MASWLSSQKIRVNSISPGPFPNLNVNPPFSEFTEVLGGKTLLGRIGHPSEMIGPIVYLASQASSYVTGSNHCVDGGWTTI